LKVPVSSLFGNDICQTLLRLVVGKLGCGDSAVAAFVLVAVFAITFKLRGPKSSVPEEKLSSDDAERSGESGTTSSLPKKLSWDTVAFSVVCPFFLAAPFFLPFFLANTSSSELELSWPSRSDTPDPWAIFSSTPRPSMIYEKMPKALERKGGFGVVSGVKLSTDIKIQENLLIHTND
jgi:hypothetical protein